MMIHYYYLYFPSVLHIPNEMMIMLLSFMHYSLAVTGLDSKAFPPSRTPSPFSLFFFLRQDLSKLLNWPDWDRTCSCPVSASQKRGLQARATSLACSTCSTWWHCDPRAHSESRKPSSPFRFN